MSVEVGEERVEQGFDQGFLSLECVETEQDGAPQKLVNCLEGSSWELRLGELNRRDLPACLPSFPL